MNMRTRSAATAVGVLSIAGIMIGALPASATTSPAVVCGQKPTANSHTAAHFIARAIIRDGLNTSCPVIGTGAPGQTAIARCIVPFSPNPAASTVYLTDDTIRVTGRASADTLAWNGSLAIC